MDTSPQSISHALGHRGRLERHAQDPVVPTHAPQVCANRQRLVRHDQDPVPRRAASTSGSGPRLASTLASSYHLPPPAVPSDGFMPTDATTGAAARARFSRPRTWAPQRSAALRRAPCPAESSLSTARGRRPSTWATRRSAAPRRAPCPVESSLSTARGRRPSTWALRRSALVGRLYSRERRRTRKRERENTSNSHRATTRAVYQHTHPAIIHKWIMGSPLPTNEIPWCGSLVSTTSSSLNNSLLHPLCCTSPPAPGACRARGGR